MSDVESLHSGINSENDVKESLLNQNCGSVYSEKDSFKSDLNQKFFQGVIASECSGSLNNGFNQTSSSAEYIKNQKTTKNTSRQQNETLTDSLVSKSSSISDKNRQIKASSRGYKRNTNNFKHGFNKFNDKRIYFNKIFLNNLLNMEQIMWTYQQIENKNNLLNNNGVLKILE